MLGRWLLVPLAVLASAGCKDAATTTAASPPDPWRTTVPYVDPDGRFGTDFPARPTSSQELQGETGRTFTLHSLDAEVEGDWRFSLAWSDAPAGTELVATQRIRTDTPEENARRDRGRVTDVRRTQLFGRPGLEFTVEAEPRGLYRDVQVVLGGRLYELTVTQRSGSRAAFDRFVESFHLLEPPVGEGARFFEVADRACADFYTGRPGPTDDATAAQRGAAVSSVVDFTEELADRLARTPASAEDQGDAAAFIDSLRRSLTPARAFAAAVARDAPDAEALGRATHADTDLTDLLAARHHADSCR